MDLPVRSGEMSSFILVEEQKISDSSFQPKEKKTKQRKKPNTFWSRGVLLSGSVDLNICAFKQEQNKL